MEFIIAFGALILGGLVGFFANKVLTENRISTAERKAHDLLEEAKNKQKQILLDSKDQALKVIGEAKEEERRQREEISRLRTRLEERETLFENKLLDFDAKQQKVYEQLEKMEAAKEEIKKIREQQLEKLEKISALTKDEARKVLLDNVEAGMKDELLGRIRKIENQSQEDLERRSRSILSNVIQRIAQTHTAESTTLIVALPNDEMKGRIIGKEGRNIKTIEQLTGVEIIVDDTPESIMISGFNPIRRHLAKKALEVLIADGRIHPARIEEVITQAKKDLVSDISKAGEDAAYQAGVVGLDPKLLQILGRLKYRTSYGQNQLQHALEVCHISTLLAHELKADVTVCRKGGLLHDIGKALDHEVQGGHPEIGYDLMKKFGLSEDTAYMAIAHHEDAPRTLEGVIVKVADAISGSRPGARRDSYENYIQRLEEIEGIANSFSGVEKTYAIQAGREVRVFINPETLDDYATKKLARDIANKIEAELKYPGEIKVTVIREKRVIEYAR